MTRIALVVSSLALVAAALVAAPAGAAPTTLTGTVGPGHTIDLRLNGRSVTRLKAGVAYRIIVRDRADDHDFRMTGPGLRRALTGVDFVGTRSVVVRFRPGAYRFFCAPHADEMRGGFRVVR